MPVAVAAPPHDRAFFGHPRGLSTLFFTEMWERFSYYGMRALLLLFMTAPVAARGPRLRTTLAGAGDRPLTPLVVMTNPPGGWGARRPIRLRRGGLPGRILVPGG